MFLSGWETALDWVGFEQLVDQWEVAAAADLDRDRVGVFWALLFLSSQGRVELEQEGCLLYTSPSPRDRQKSRMPSSA